jgi:hypothetical protein
MTYVLVSKTLKLVCLEEGITMLKACGGYCKMFKNDPLQK